jgi:hypothetical protein
MKFIKSYAIGNGDVSIGIGTEKNTKTRFLSIGDIENSSFKVGDDINISDISDQDVTIIFVKNLAGFAVLERAIKRLKKELKNDLLKTIKNN